MLDQMQVTTPIDALSASPVSSYAIGPVDPMQFSALHAHLSTGEEYSLLVPIHLPPSILTHAMFKDGYEWGYTESDPEEEWTVPKLVNEVYHLLAELCYKDEPDLCPWTLGFLLGELASVAEQTGHLPSPGWHITVSCCLSSRQTMPSPGCPTASYSGRERCIIMRYVPTGRGCVSIGSKARASQKRNAWR